MKSGLDPIASPASRVLILGTMPGEKSLACQQYYANPNNQLWKLLSAILAEPTPISYEDRVRFLLRQDIAVWDVLASCDRVGSSDSAIAEELPNDFEQFFRRHTAIDVLFFNGKKAEALFRKHVTCKQGLAFATLPSSSPACAMRFEHKAKAWVAIADALKR
ncbi:MAG: DNA-deoxyinosine glycosylase [Armatimonadota bacterium]|nr:DNA-deoxyinosine glycosylase [Armatimonadota bacterium]